MKINKKIKKLTKEEIDFLNKGLEDAKITFYDKDVLKVIQDCAKKMNRAKIMMDEADNLLEEVRRELIDEKIN